MKSQELDELTKEFLRSGGVIKVLGARVTEKINFSQIVREYGIDPITLLHKISSGQFAKPAVGGHEIKSTTDKKKWFRHEVENFLRHGKKGFNE